MAISKKLVRARKKKAPMPPFSVELGTFHFYPSAIEDQQRMVDLFEALGYDIKIRDHWLHILNELSKGYFARGQGNPEKWNEQSRTKMASHLYALHVNGLLKGGRSNHADLLKKHFPFDPLYKGSAHQIYLNILAHDREMEARTTPALANAKKSRRA
jgi:hypothetical protein